MENTVQEMYRSLKFPGRPSGKNRLKEVKKEQRSNAGLFLNKPQNKKDKVDHLYRILDFFLCFLDSRIRIKFLMTSGKVDFRSKFLKLVLGRLGK